MPDLTVRIKKTADGGSALTCIRRDGTTTWQRHQGARGRFFPWHDLTHYAVETVLGRAHGFYGLVAEGWDLDDFGAPWPRGPVPWEAGAVELVVGLLDAERSGGVYWTAAEFNQGAQAHLVAQGDREHEPPVLTEDDLIRIRAARARVFAQWVALPPGQAIELPFERTTVSR